MFSEDGGNVTLFFKKAESVADQAASWGIPENAERITAIVRGHTNLRHYMRAAPYLRFIKRMTRSLFENRDVKGFENNKSLLDQLYRGL